MRAMKQPIVLLNNNPKDAKADQRQMRSVKISMRAKLYMRVNPNSGSKGALGISAFRIRTTNHK